MVDAREDARAGDQGQRRRPPMRLKPVAAVALAASVVLVSAAALGVKVGGLFGSTPTTSTLALTCALPTSPLPRGGGDFKTGFIYQVMLDRFFDGDPSNDNPASAPGLNDPTHTNWKLYWGGDLKGLTEKIPYIAGMGATAIWISPPVENVNKPLDFGDGNGPQAGYHGYWAMDDYQIDPHLGTWADFDAFIAAAHAHGLSIMVDFPANDSNPTGLGLDGAIYQNGTLKASAGNDPNGWFHHNPTISDFNDLDDLEYGSLEGLADFAQENPQVDAYLKGAIAQFIAHGVDGIRIDAAKHMPGPSGGWLRTVADGVEASGSGPRFLTGEWQVSDPTDPTYPDAVRFANQSGISLLNFAVMHALDAAYAGSALAGPVAVDQVVRSQAQALNWPNDQVNFIDNHDFPRFLSLDNSHDALHQALAVVMTLPGVPVVYYGTEQYLHDDTNGGGDPYNRPMMTSFATSTPAYALVRCLGSLRASNPALAYGSYAPLQVSHALYAFERAFGNSAVVVAVNSGLDPVTLRPAQTGLPAGVYSDLLRGAFGGPSLRVGSGGTTQAVTLKPNAIAIWQYTDPHPSAPLVGSMGPELAHPGETLQIDGQGFAAGDTVQIGASAATILSATGASITAKVPNMPGGAYQVKVCAGTTCGAGYALNIASGPQIPVNITMRGLPRLTPEQHVYLTGPLTELGGGATDPAHALGPFLAAPTGNTPPVLLASLPACQAVSFSAEIVDVTGHITPEGVTQSISVPCQGEGTATVTWGTP